MWHHFWFLEVSLAGVPLRTVCALVLAAMVPAALLPGMLYAGEGVASCLGKAGWSPGRLLGMKRSWLAACLSGKLLRRAKVAAGTLLQAAHPMLPPGRLPALACS